ncbi:MAG: acyltransferase [Clostridiaceae bacterium]|nr:acyltransferase [Clostridiaceae bacterium]
MNNHKVKSLNSRTKTRLIGLDILRILAALNIYAGHAVAQLKISFGFLHPLIKLRGFFMSTFFMLSGFILYVIYSQQDLKELKILKTYYLKRIIGIIPLYYFISFLHLIFINTSTLNETILLIPIEMIGFQSVFENLFFYVHNGGTWFISCLVFCYFLFPYLQELVKFMTQKLRIGLFILLAIFLTYLFVVRDNIGLQGIYSNVIYRATEFFLGILCANYFLYFRERKPILSKLKNISLQLIVFVLCILIVVCLYNNFTILSVKVLDLFTYVFIALLLILVSSVRYPSFLENSKILNYLSAITFAFFLVQYFTWPISKRISVLLSQEGNKSLIIISLITNLLLSILVYELFEKPVTKKLRQKFLKHN